MLSSAPAARADINGKISGIVTDPSVAVVPGVQVVAREKQTGVEHSVETNGAGFYSFAELPVGQYDVIIRQPGFREFPQTALVIHANSAIRVDVRLQVGDTSRVSPSRVQRFKWKPQARKWGS
jgi:hypothetical protein